MLFIYIAPLCNTSHPTLFRYPYSSPILLVTVCSVLDLWLTWPYPPTCTRSGQTGPAWSSELSQPLQLALSRFTSADSFVCASTERRAQLLRLFLLVFQARSLGRQRKPSRRPPRDQGVGAARQGRRPVPQEVALCRPAVVW